MIILGDIAAPDIEHVKYLNSLFSKYSFFSDNKIILNLEGLISEDNHKTAKTPVLYSHPKISEMLSRNGVVVVALANNHTLDLPGEFNTTKELLEAQEIQYVGAGLNLQDAYKPVLFRDRDQEVFVFNYCWDFLLYHQNNPDQGIHVATIQEQFIVKEIVNAKLKFPERKIVVYLHWNFDLEVLPFPMHREFSRELIDHGVNLVVGCHSHCVQGGEAYKNGYIVYGLGNFYLPQNVFSAGQIDYPDFANREIVFEWDPKTNEANCHWFEYNKNLAQLDFIKSEDFLTGTMFARHSPFAGMSDNDYLIFFKKNRRKRTMIPVFESYRDTNKNKFYMELLKVRAKIARYFASLGLIKWTN